MSFSIWQVDLANGGCVGMCRLPGVTGALDADLDVVFDWRPDIVVSLTGENEMAATGADGLGARLIAGGVEWIHLPIADYGGPSGESAKRWPAIRDRLLEQLEDGKAVLVHCRGGQGRSGMLALRLLVEMGWAPGDALAALREGVPGAVESNEQMRWATEL
ncbi:hypothetical protein [Pelagibacterium halotolerans]|uniref:phosphatase domain-containing protein n=1 Tax=Pelagibacterium halotolerans TaxID=531813 RepID=UPI003850BE76